MSRFVDFFQLSDRYLRVKLRRVDAGMAEHGLNEPNVDPVLQRGAGFQGCHEDRIDCRKLCIPFPWLLKRLHPGAPL